LGSGQHPVELAARSNIVNMHVTDGCSQAKGILGRQLRGSHSQSQPEARVKQRKEDVESIAEEHQGLDIMAPSSRSRHRHAQASLAMVHTPTYCMAEGNGETD
jgi:hypothetical protein